MPSENKSCARLYRARRARAQAPTHSPGLGPTPEFTCVSCNCTGPAHPWRYSPLLAPRPPRLARGWRSGAPACAPAAACAHMRILSHDQTRPANAEAVRPGPSKYGLCAARGGTMAPPLAPALQCAARLKSIRNRALPGRQIFPSILIICVGTPTPVAKQVAHHRPLCTGRAAPPPIHAPRRPVTRHHLNSKTLAVWQAPAAPTQHTLAPLTRHTRPRCHGAPAPPALFSRCSPGTYHRQGCFGSPGLTRGRANTNRCCCYCAPVPALCGMLPRSVAALLRARDATPNCLRFCRDQGPPAGGPGIPRPPRARPESVWVPHLRRCM